jgi:hypothetical protein
MAGVATDGRAGVQGEGAAVAPEALTNISTQAVTPEFLVDLVKTPELALKVVKCEVERRELFTKKRSDGFLPKHEGKDGSTVVASNVWNREQLKNLNLCGKDVTNTFVLLDEGETKLLGDFIRELGDAEAVKKCLQGLVYNADTKFYKKGEEEKNSALLNFLNNDEISSEFKGNVNELVQVASLVEPPLKRFADLLIPSEAAARPEFAGADDAVEAGTPPARRVGEPESAGDADTASLGQVGSQQQSNTGEKAASKPRDNGEDTDSQDSLRRELSGLLSGRAQFIRREVLTSEEADSSNEKRENREDEEVELVKAWLRKQFCSEPFGAMREVVSANAAAGPTEGSAGSGESLEADTPATYSSSDSNSAGNLGTIVRQHSSAQDVLENLQEGMIEIGIQSDVLAHKSFSVEQLLNGQYVIYPVLYSLREGSIDQVSLANFYEVNPGQLGNCYGITDLAKIEIDQGGQISVTEKGKLFLPPNHPYFDNTSAPS